MTKFFLKIGLLVFLVGTLWLLLFFFFPKPAPAQDPVYEAAILDKHRLLEQTRPPRLIFVGGSGLAFGLDSELIEKQIGMRVVNMGLHVGFGLRYMLSEVKPFIRKGDVVIVISEYEPFFGSAFDGGFELAFIVMRFPECRQYITSWKQYVMIIKNSPMAIRASVYNQLSNQLFSTSFAYCRSAFNAHGDSLGHLNKERPGVFGRETINGPINPEAIAALNDLELYARVQGAKVFLIYPATEEKKYRHEEEKINLLARVFRKELKVPVLGTPGEDVFPEDHFYDTDYHLNARARQIRTQRVITRLKSVL